MDDWALMDDWAWVAPVALIVTLVAIPATVWATRQWGNRMARVDITVGSIPLLSRDAPEGLLEVTYREIPVKNPHLVSVTLRNAGPRDLTSAMFDGGRPITISFNQTFYGLTSTEGGVQTLAPAIGTPADEAEVEIKPALLKRRDAWSFSAVLTGPVEATINAPLIDTDVKQVDPGSGLVTATILAATVPGILGGLSGILGGLAGILFPPTRRDR